MSEVVNPKAGHDTVQYISLYIKCHVYMHLGSLSCDLVSLSCTTAYLSLPMH